MRLHVVSEIAKCHAEFRGERSLLPVFRKFFASSLQVFCIEFVALTVLAVPKMLKNDKFQNCAQNHVAKHCFWPGGSQNLLKSSKCDLGRFRRPLGRRLVQGTQGGKRVTENFQHFGTTWLILGAILHAHWILKGVPKSSFLT